MNEITTYKGNSKTISFNVPAGYSSGYTLTFIVNNHEAGDGTPIFTISGVPITNQVAVVSVTATQNNIIEGVYFYETYISKAALKYTIAKSSYTILPSLI